MTEAELGAAMLQLARAEKHQPKLPKAAQYRESIEVAASGLRMYLRGNQGASKKQVMEDMGVSRGNLVPMLRQLEVQGGIAYAKRGNRTRMFSSEQIRNDWLKENDPKGLYVASK